jgi:lipopolysaccharide transport system ATP-binding protein
MSDRVSIRVDGLSKRYYLGLGRRRARVTLGEMLAQATSARLARLASALRPRPRKSAPTGRGGVTGGTPQRERPTVWALQDVSLRVAPGEVVGIIGKNGAGKSTLLKILTRITAPTAGRAEIHGRVGSLLEVGTGFHSELTGRENVYLNGAILGMRRLEIRRKFDDIVAFSGLERFLDTPVKRYSSGMYMRLAFAVAAHLDPEILLVDEVLAVGDAAFQQKCLRKMSEVAHEGRTILFVSHNLAAVTALCDRVVWLDDGRVVREGEPADVVSTYLRTSFSTRTDRVWSEPAEAPGNERVRLRRACVRPVKGSPADPITVRTPFVVELEYWNLQPGARLLSVHFSNEKGVVIFDSLPLDKPVWKPRPTPVGLFREACWVPGDLLNDGMHRVQLVVMDDRGTIVFREDDVLVFDVLETPQAGGAWYGKRQGTVRPVLQWTSERLDEPAPAGPVDQTLETRREA